MPASAGSGSRWRALRSVLPLAVGLTLLTIASGPIGLLPASPGGSTPASLPLGHSLHSDLPASRPRVALTPDGAPHASPARPSSSHGNSSPSGDPGTRIGEVPLSYGTYGVNVDPKNGYVYVTNKYGSGNLTILNGTKVVSTLLQSSNTSCAVYDPADGWVYVCDYGNNTVTVLNGTRTVATIGSSGFQGPDQGIYDPADGDVYVGNINSNTVSVLNGSSVVTTLTVGRYPAGFAYDPVSHEVYVTNTAIPANGGSFLSIINHTSVVGTVTGNFANPIGIAFDAANGELYVADKNLSNPSHGFIDLVKAGKVVATLYVSGEPWGATYDATNQLVDVSTSDNDIGLTGYDEVEVVNSSAIVRSIPIWTNAYGIAYDPVNGLVYVANAGYGLNPGNVSLISSTIWAGLVAPSPIGSPPFSTDVGLTVNASATIAPNWNPRFVQTISVVPASGMSCGGGAGSQLGIPSTVRFDCRATAAGNYTVWLNLTDSGSAGAQSWFHLEVFPRLSVRASASPPAIDVGQAVVMRAALTGGSGGDLYQWRGLPAASCSLLTFANVTCRPNVVQNLSANVTVSDANGAIATSPGRLNVTVSRVPTILGIRSSTWSIDLGQTVVLGAEFSGGTGPWTILWGGLPPGCPPTNASPLDCRPTASGSFGVNLTVRDATGFEVGTPLAQTLAVSPALSATAPAPNRTTADIGQPIRFSAGTAGGFGNRTYGWSGLPTGCSSASSASPVCPFSAPGSVSVSFRATDGNGANVTSPPTLVTIYADPTLSPLSIAPASVEAGRSVTISTTVEGGPGAYTFTWKGLPPGCLSENRSNITCSPSVAGSFSPSVTVVDARGYSVSAGAANPLTVTSAPATGPSTLEWAAIGGAIVVAVVLACLLWLRRRATGPRSARPGPSPRSPAK